MVKRVITTDKTTNKDIRVTVRLTPRQEHELFRIAKAHKVAASGLVRAMLDRFIEAYYGKHRG